MTDPHLTVNGRRRSLTGASAHTNLLDALRGFGLTGAKEGCAEGECGACAVMVARPDGATSRWTAINSCLAPALALDGQEVVTAEGLGTSRALHPVQRQRLPPMAWRSKPLGPCSGSVWASGSASSRGVRSGR